MKIFFLSYGMDTNIWFLGLFKWNNVMWRWRCRWCFQLNITEITLHDECQYSSVVVVFTLRHTQLLYSSLITMVAGGVWGGVVSALPADIWWPGLKANMRECPEQWQQWRREEGEHGGSWRSPGPHQAARRCDSERESSATTTTLTISLLQNKLTLVEI